MRSGSPRATSRSSTTRNSAPDPVLTLSSRKWSERTTGRPSSARPSFPISTLSSSSLGSAARPSSGGSAMLARIRKMAEEREGGFTLIELLVVIIIIGILAAIAIPVFLNQRQKGYDAQAKSDARNLATLEETYLTDNDKYKTEAAATAALTGARADLGYKPSANVTDVEIKTYDATGAAATDGVGSYCIDV